MAEPRRYQLQNEAANRLIADLLDVEEVPAERRGYYQQLLTTALEIPEIEIGHIETPSPLNALGIKGVGEAGAIPVPALVAEAIDDALAPLGVRVREMPLDPDRLRRLIEQARGSAR